MSKISPKVRFEISAPGFLSRAERISRSAKTAVYSTKAVVKYSVAFFRYVMWIFLTVVRFISF